MLQPYSQSDLLDACMAFTGPLEGRVLWPYLDGGSLPTVGVGHLLYSELYAQTLFGVSAPSFIAQWDDLMLAKPGMAASFYETITDLRITQEQSDQIFRADLEAHVAKCAKLIPGFMQLPGPAQVGLIDIDFNVSGGIGIFHHLLADVAAANWTQAALDCHRKEIPQPGGISPARNEATRALFLSVIGSVT